MASYNAHPLVATSDLWPASSQNLYVKGNFDFFAEFRPIELNIQRSYPPQSGVVGAAKEQVESSDGSTLKPTTCQLRYDASQDEARMWDGELPYHFGSALTLKLNYKMAGANVAKTAEFNVQIACISDGDSSVSAKAFDSVNTSSVTVPATADEEEVITITLTNDDSAAPGDRFTIVIWVDVSDSTFAADLIITGAELRYSA